jgi:alkylhydroperoxidase family enzyme
MTAGMGGTADRHAARLARLRQAVFSSPGATTSASRAAAADGGPLPEPMDTYAAMVRDHSYRVTDDDIEALKAAGVSEDEIFEMTVAAALGAALRSLDAGLDAMRGTD